jgi:NADPH-dependent glutamate synthase beta subunit-like oxidoreductase
VAHPAEKKQHKIDGKPVAICWLKRACADYREFRHHTTSPPTIKEKSVAVVGAGSAGLACARDLRERGYPVTMYEAEPVAGGVMVNGIPLWRLPRQVTYEETTKYMYDLGVEVHYNTHIGRDMQVVDLLERYAAVYLSYAASLRVNHKSMTSQDFGTSACPDKRSGPPVNAANMCIPSSGQVCTVDTYFKRS